MDTEYGCVQACSCVHSAHIHRVREAKFHIVLLWIIFALLEFTDMKQLDILNFSNRFDGVNSNLGHSTQRRHNLWIIYDQLFIITYIFFFLSLIVYLIFSLHKDWCAQFFLKNEMHYSFQRAIVINDGYSFLFLLNFVLISINQSLHLSPD